jgi:predicted transcriptional regulator
VITTLIIAVVVSWVLLLYFLFLYERLEQRLTSLTIVQQHMMKVQEEIAKKLDVSVQDDEISLAIDDLVKDGKTYEAVETYRRYRGVSVREAREFVRRQA